MAFSGYTALDYFLAATAVTATAVAASQAGGARPVIPPSPVIPQPQVDQSAQEAENQSRRRQQLAGGILSTVGTSGGESGATLNPSTLSQASLLGK